MTWQQTLHEDSFRGFGTGSCEEISSQLPDEVTTLRTALGVARPMVVTSSALHHSNVIANVSPGLNPPAGPSPQPGRSIIRISAFYAR
jgi:hypothetical protein